MQNDEDYVVDEFNLTRIPAAILKEEGSHRIAGFKQVGVDGEYRYGVTFNGKVLVIKRHEHLVALMPLKAVYEHLVAIAQENEQE